MISCVFDMCSKFSMFQCFKLMCKDTTFFHYSKKNAPAGAGAFFFQNTLDVLFNVLLAVLDVDTGLGNALELAAHEVEDAVVNLIAGDSADTS